MLASGPESDWKVPTYIAEGLEWLQSEVAHEIEAEAAVVADAAAIELVDFGNIAADAGAGVTT